MLHLTPWITVYCAVVAALLGACMGSFLNCLAWRTVHGESVLRGRSHCDVCGHVLGVRDLVPVVSFLLSGGKCRYCGAKLSRRHLAAELVSAAVFVTLLFQYDISLQTLEAWILACVLLAASFADLEGYIIPDRFIMVGIVLFFASILWHPGPLHRLLSGAIGGFAVAGALLLLVLWLEKRLELPAVLPAPVAEGEEIGALSVRAGEREVCRIPILAGEEVPRLTLWDIFRRVLCCAAMKNFMENS